VPWPIRGALLKPAFAGRSLLEAAVRVELALAQRRLVDARKELAWLVSRPTEGLDEKLINAAVIESLAENLVDSWIAPLLGYAAFGLAGAYAYRAANTADAMWGYRTSDYEWLGKGAARLDDLLNWAPARVGTVMIVAVAGRNSRRSLQAWRACASSTASPNAGQTMAAIAGALDVTLEKQGHYVLHPQGCSPSTVHVERSRRMVGRAMLLSAGLCVLIRAGHRDG
jgi:adenosylcobinamide-phosphate synthase